MSPCRILEPAEEALPRLLPELAEILHQAVLAGASVGFVLPFTQVEAMAFWQRLVPAFRSGARRLLVACRDGRAVGTVQLVLDMPPNGRHRAEISKLLVHPARRRLGIARALMLEAEVLARRHGRKLICLDTRSGDAAEGLYRSLGYVVGGVVPGYARSTDGSLAATSFLYKLLSSGEA